MRLLSVCVALAFAGAVANAQIVINEFAYDDTSTDNKEFVELYNAGTTPVAIAGWTLENRDTVGFALASPITIPAGTAIAAGGFYVIGNAAVPNVNQVVVINFLENDNEAIILKDNLGAIMDRVGYEICKVVSGVTPAGNYEGTPIWGEHQLIDGFAAAFGRCQDGADSNNNGADFMMMPWSPGATNNGMANALPSCDDFEGRGVETDVPGWYAGFARPQIVNPTVASRSVINPVPASPDGGNCLSAWDPAGGGNSVFLTSTPVADITFEAWVYFFVGHVAPDQEQWSIGVRNGGDTLHQFHTPAAGSLNGNSGICWEYVTNSAGGTLTLVDEGFSGPIQTTLATIPVPASGWYRLRLSVAGATIAANFGGSFGDPNGGTVVSGLTATTRCGTVTVGYRESAPATGTANVRPVMLDRVEITSPAFPACLKRYQSNQSGSSFTIDGVQGGRFTKATTNKCLSAATILNFNSTAVTLPWDLAIAADALTPGGAFAIATAQGQLININLITPSFPVSFLNGGVAPDLVSTIFPGAFTLSFTTPPVPVLASAQMVNIDPTNPEFFSLSQGAEVVTGATPSVSGPNIEDGEVVMTLAAAPLCAPNLPFYGTSFSQIRVQTNGRVVFGGPNGNNTSFAPTVASALLNNPFVGAWADFSITGSTSPVSVQITGTGSVRVNWTNAPYWDTGLSSSFSIDLDPVTGIVTLGGLGGIATTNLQPMMIGMSGGNLVGAIDPGQTVFGPAPITGSTSSPNPMLYSLGTAPPATGVGTILFVPNLFGNYDWGTAP